MKQYPRMAALLLALLILMIVMHEQLTRKTACK